MKSFFLSFFVAAALFSCNTSTTKKEKAAPEIPSAPLDTVKFRPAHFKAQPVLFEGAFVKGTTRKEENITTSFYAFTMGNLKVSSGHLIACDPLHIDEYGIPFTQQFPTGVFPVQLSIISAGGEELIAFARILFNNDPVEKWEIALLAGQKPLSIWSREIHGFSIDGSRGVFIDSAASKDLDFKHVEDFNGAAYKEMNLHQHPGWFYGMYNFGNHNLAMFKTGMDDGYYASYIGFNAEGKPCRLLTDFGIVYWKGK